MEGFQKKGSDKWGDSEEPAVSEAAVKWVSECVFGEVIVEAFISAPVIYTWGHWKNAGAANITWDDIWL